MEDFMISIFQIGMGIFWAITYLYIIKQGFRDQTVGVPVTALCANIAWEFIFSFIYPHGGLQGTIDKVWLTLDFIILIQYIQYGRQEFALRLPVKFFYPHLILMVTLSFAVILGTVHEFLDWQGKYAAFGQNLMMSMLFISMLLGRGNCKGQSMHIACYKMIGSLIPALGFYLYYRSGLITVLSIATLVFDLIYAGLLYKELLMDRHGESPNVSLVVATKT